MGFQLNMAEISCTCSENATWGRAVRCRAQFRFDAGFGTIAARLGGDQQIVRPERGFWPKLMRLATAPSRPISSSRLRCAKAPWIFIIRQV